MVKLDKSRYPNRKQSMERIIEILRAGIKPSRGLKECIESLKNKYSWGTGKMLVSCTMSFLKNIALGWSLYGFDVYTDYKFLQEMFTFAQTNFTEQFNVCTQKQNEILFNFVAQCNTESFNATSGKCLQMWDSAYGGSSALRCEEFRGRFNDSNAYYEAGVVSLGHIISPFAFSFGIFFVLCCTQVFEFNWSLPWKLPIPPFTKTLKFINECRYYINNTKMDNETFEEEKKILMQV